MSEMTDTRFDGATQGLGAREELNRYMLACAADNSAAVGLMRRCIRRAIDDELTPRQRQVLCMYYDRGMSMPGIAEELGLNKSTVSRTLKRSVIRLGRSLKYSEEFLRGPEE